MKLIDMVRNTLASHPETRNSDTKLAIELWVRFYPEKIKKGSNGSLGIYLEDLMDLPAASAIERYRRKLNEQGELLPTDPEVLKARGFMEDVWKENLGYPVHNEQE